MTVLIPFAKESKTEQIQSIHEVQNGLACNCLCLSCGTAVVAKQGTKNAWHFAHANKEQSEICEISFARSVYKMLLQEVRHYRQFMPASAVLSFSSPATIDEVIFVENSPADMLIKCGNHQFAIFLSFKGRPFDFTSAKVIPKDNLILEVDLDEYRIFFDEPKATSSKLILEKAFCHSTGGKIFHSRPTEPSRALTTKEKASKLTPLFTPDSRHLMPHLYRCLNCGQTWQGFGEPQKCKFCSSPIVSKTPHRSG